MKLDSGSVDAGVDERRSVYEMNDRRFDAPLGEGGACEASPPLAVVGVIGDDGEGMVCSGFSWRVAVVGEDSSELTEK